MTAAADHFAGLLCHCDQTEHLPDDGHPLGTPGCASQVEKGCYHDGWCAERHEFAPVDHSCHGTVRGTCPTCGKRGRVVRIEFRAGPDGQLRRGLRTGPIIEARAGMAPHRTGGAECPGTGQVPAETTYRPGRLITDWLAAQERDGAA